MFARVARFEGMQSEDESTLGGARGRAAEILDGVAGWQGGMQLLDRESGVALNIALFDSEENMQAAEQTFEELPQRLGVQGIAARRTAVERYEVIGELRKGS